jgi:hypothetical protein
MAHHVNYLDLLQRFTLPWASGLPALASKLVGTVLSAVPESTGVLFRWVVRSVTFLPVRHSGHAPDERFLSPAS